MLCYSLFVTVGCWLLTAHCFAQNNKAKQLYDQSIRLFGERKVHEAIPFMEQALKEDPNYTDAYLKLGQLYEFTSTLR